MTKENEFKNKAVELLRELRLNGVVYFDDIDVDNVKDLCGILEVSSYSLYNWDKQYPFHVKESIPEVFEPEISDELPEWVFNGNFLEHKDEARGFNPNKIRFLSWLGGELGIPNANRLHKNDLLLKIGLKLIKESKLVKTNGGA